MDRELVKLAEQIGLLKDLGLTPERSEAMTPWEFHAASEGRRQELLAVVEVNERELRITDSIGEVLYAQPPGITVGDCYIQGPLNHLMNPDGTYKDPKEPAACYEL